MIYTLDTSSSRITISSNRNDSISSHCSNELRRCKDNSTRTICSYCRDKLHHFSAIKCSTSSSVVLWNASLRESSAQSLLNFLIYSISLSLNKQANEISHIFSTIKHSFEVDCASSTDCMSAYFKVTMVKSECFIYTRETNLCKELSCSSSSQSCSEQSLLSLTNLLNISKNANSVDNLLRNYFISSLNNDFINVISVLHELIDRTGHFSQTLNKSVLNILHGVVSRSFIPSRAKGQFFHFLNSHVFTPLLRS